jgi:transposase
MPKLITKTQVETAVKAYLNGSPQKDAAAAGGMSIQTLRTHLKAQGIETDPHRRREHSLTEKERKEIVDFYKERIGTLDIAEKFDVGVHTIYSTLRKAGVLRVRGTGGPGNSSPVGTTRVDGVGYVVEKVPDDWKFRGLMSGFGDGTWIMQHRKVMAEILDRPLRPGEQVHHKDGDKVNNSPENLQLRIGAHGTGHCMQCAKCGSHDLVATTL